MGFDQVQKRACCLDNNAKTHWKKALNNSSEKFHHGRLRATWWCAWKQGNTIKSRNLSSQRLRVLSWCKRRSMFPAIFEGSCALQCKQLPWALTWRTRSCHTGKHTSVYLLWNHRQAVVFKVNLEAKLNLNFFSFGVRKILECHIQKGRGVIDVTCQKSIWNVVQCMKP